MAIIAIATAIFFWAVKSGQYDDLNTDGRRILFDDPEPLAPNANPSQPALAPEAVKPLVQENTRD